MLTATKTSLENKHLGNGDYIILLFLLLPRIGNKGIFGRAHGKWTDRSAFEVNKIIENERFAVVSSRCC